MVTAYLGIDVSKAKLDACLLLNPLDSGDDRSLTSVKLKNIVASNDEKGFQVLIQWLSQNKVTMAGELHACAFTPA